MRIPGSVVTRSCPANFGFGLGVEFKGRAPVDYPLCAIIQPPLNFIGMVDDEIRAPFPRIVLR